MFAKNHIYQYIIYNPKGYNINQENVYQEKQIQHCHFHKIVFQDNEIIQKQCCYETIYAIEISFLETVLTLEIMEQ